MCLSLVDLGGASRGLRSRPTEPARPRYARARRSGGHHRKPTVAAWAHGALPRARSRVRGAGTSPAPVRAGPVIADLARTRARRSYRGGGWGDVNPWSRRREMGRAAAGPAAAAPGLTGLTGPGGAATLVLDRRSVGRRSNASRPPIGAHQPIRPGARHGPARHTARSHGPQRTRISPRRPAGSPPNDRRRRRGGPGAPHRRRRAHRPGPFGIRTRLRGVDPGR